VLGVFLSTISFAQDEYTKHQLGINASKFVILFNEQVNNLDISYRYSVNPNFNLRSSFSLDYSSDENDISDLSLRLGVDKNFLHSNNWSFYYGLDFNYTFSVVNSIDRTNQNYGAYLFMGFLYKLGKHFSLSTEPSLAFLRFKTEDKSSFNPNANRSWTEVKLLNIGQIKMSFHF